MEKRQSSQAVTLHICKFCNYNCPDICTNNLFCFSTLVSIILLLVLTGTAIDALRIQKKKKEEPPPIQNGIHPWHIHYIFSFCLSCSHSFSNSAVGCFVGGFHTGHVMWNICWSHRNHRSWLKAPSLMLMQPKFYPGCFYTQRHSRLLQKCDRSFFPTLSSSFKPIASCSWFTSTLWSDLSNSWRWNSLKLSTQSLGMTLLRIFWSDTSFLCGQFFSEYLRECILGFSFYSNTKKLMDTSSAKTGQITCLNGIRFWSMTWVLTTHVYAGFFISVPMGNLGYFFGEVRLLNAY